MISDLLKSQIDLLPDKPGVYLMKDESDKIIYIGKAKNLKKRVSQYFLRPQTGKVAAMVMHVHHFETIILKSEKEAFILEMNLIQTHYPRYNIMLMDDSHYPYIALHKHGDPYLKIARNSKDKNYFYFGPFPSSGSASETLDLLNKIFPLRKCHHLQAKPCLYYSLGQCLAPCINRIDEEELDSVYERIKAFFNGDCSSIKSSLKEKMNLASENLEFEKASEYKKTLDAIEHVLSKQAVEITGQRKDYDVISYAEREGYRCLAILSYRRGLLLGKKTHVVPSFGLAAEQIGELFAQYCLNHEYAPLLLTRIEGLKEEIESLIDNIEVFSPKEGRLLEAISLAELNARSGLDAHFFSARLEEDKLELLEGLGKLLAINTPYRIELFDNSHLQGSSPVGAMVCYINGEKAKGMYRKFHLKEEDAGDDYHSMKEVVYRRYKRLKEENKPYPDLILCDGGLTQVHATLEALYELNISIGVFGLFKNDKHQTSGLIDKNGKEYPLDNKSPLFFFLMRMQDEVHRFAISFHKATRGKAMKAEIFDGIEGLGDKRKEVLFSHYPTLEDLLLASLDELKQVLPNNVAYSLFERLHKS